MRRALLVVACSVALVGCDEEYPNPFTGTQTPTVVPPDDATLQFAANSHAAAGAGKELFAASDVGGASTRLTFCATGGPCDVLEASFAPDGQRAALRRVTDTNGDGRLSDADGVALVYVDLARQVEAELVAASRRVSGVGWSPVEELLVFSATGAGGSGEDLFRTLPRRATPDNQQETRNLTCPGDVVGPPAGCDPAILERHPRIDPAGTVAAYERTLPGSPSEIWVFLSSAAQQRVSVGGPAGDVLAGTPYRIGSDANPAYSPDGRFIAFRRLTGPGDGRGHWDVYTVRTDGTELSPLAAGPAFRGAPDWGPRGITFVESGADGVPRIVLAVPGGARREVMSLAAGFEIAFPRWLP